MTFRLLHVNRISFCYYFFQNRLWVNSVKLTLFGCDLTIRAHNLLLARKIRHVQ